MFALWRVHQFCCCFLILGVLLPYDGHEWSLDLDTHIQLHDVFFVWCVPFTWKIASTDVFQVQPVAAFCSIAVTKGKVYIVMGT